MYAMFLHIYRSLPNCCHIVKDITSIFKTWEFFFIALNFYHNLNHFKTIITVMSFFNITEFKQTGTTCPFYFVLYLSILILPRGSPKIFLRSSRLYRIETIGWTLCFSGNKSFCFSFPGHLFRGFIVYLGWIIPFREISCVPNIITI